MKRLITALVALFAIGCGYDIDPRAAGYVAKFEFYTGVPANLDIKFGVTPPLFLGYCKDREFGIDEITLSPDLLGGNPNILEAVIYHELGHCALGYKDYDKPIGPCKTSLMHPNAISASSDCFARNWPLHIRALVTGYPPITSEE